MQDRIPHLKAPLMEQLQLPIALLVLAYLPQSGQTNITIKNMKKPIAIKTPIVLSAIKVVFENMPSDFSFSREKRLSLQSLQNCYNYQ